MKNYTLYFTLLLLFSQLLMAVENLEPESVKVSQKIIAINKEAIRAPASVEIKEEQSEEETLTDAMEKVEEPQLWFNP